MYIETHTPVLEFPRREPVLFTTSSRLFFFSSWHFSACRPINTVELKTNTRWKTCGDMGDITYTTGQDLAVDGLLFSIWAPRYKLCCLPLPPLICAHLCAPCRAVLLMSPSFSPRLVSGCVDRWRCRPDPCSCAPWASVSPPTFRVLHQSCCAVEQHLTHERGGRALSRPAQR